MAAKDNKYETAFTPPSIFVWPKFEVPDVYVDPKTKKEGKPCYRTDAAEINKGDFDKLKAQTIAFMVKHIDGVDPETRKVTLKNGDIKTLYWPFKVDEKTGDVLLTAKSVRTSKRTEELIRPPMFDAANQKLPDDIYPGGGTVGRLKLSLAIMPNDAGVNFYIDQVQVLKLQENSFGKSDFEAAEGYTYTPPSSGSDFEEADEGDATKF